MKVLPEAQKLYEKAVELYSKKEYEEALTFFNESLKIEPNFAEAMSYLATVHGYLGFKQLSKTEAFELLEKALNLNPDSAVVLKNMGQGYRGIKKDYNNAIKYFKKAKLKDPALEINLSLGFVYFQKGEYETAIEYFKKIQ